MSTASTATQTGVEARPQLTPEVIAQDCDAFAQTPNPQTAQRLQQRRLQFVEAIITLPAGALAANWGGLAPMHARLLGCGLRDFVRSPQDEQLFGRLKALLPQLPTQPVIPEVLAAVMLLSRNFELPLLPDLEKVPEWLRASWFGFLLESPQVFNLHGEADRYVDYLEALTGFVHAQWVQRGDANTSPGTRELAHAFAAQAIFTQAYFSPRNLRPLYEKRGAIIEAFLNVHGIPVLATSVPKLDTPNGTSPARKIKLGIYANRFTPGTETFFTLSHFEHLDRSRFDVTLYTLAVTGHPLEDYCSSRVDRVVVLSANDLVSQMQRIRADELDILLISTNMTTHAITPMLLGSARLAPIQVASVSSPVTTGARHTDVLLSAEWNEPEADAREHYTEHLELLPGSINYYAYHHDHDQRTIELNRAALGIADDAVVFFSGANFFKVLPELSADWVRILAQVPNSVLLLMPFNPNWGSHYQRLPFLARVQQQMQALGVVPERLRVIDCVPTRADVHCVMQLADVYLDAYPFAGACSMLDSIIVGVPPVVRRGPVGRSNHGASLLRMAELAGLSCSTSEEYIQKAVALARDPAERQRIRQHLQDLGKPAVPVYYDTRLFSARVGAALTSLWQRHQSRYQRLAADIPRLREVVEQSAANLIAKGPALNALTDIGIIKLLIEPYFRNLPTDRPRHALDVGACHGAMSAPLLASGWTADLFEPDPAARQQLLQSLAPYEKQIRTHALAAGSQSATAVPFHQAAVQGLSGLGDSPFGATTRIVEVPCTTLTDFCTGQALKHIDFLKIDAEGYDFEVLASLDFARWSPELVLVEFGTHFARQCLEVINKAVAQMAANGYGAVIFEYADDGNFARSKWVYRLTAISLDRTLTPTAEQRFGNILFYKAGNPRLLLTLLSLLDSCGDPKQRLGQTPDSTAVS